jgi:pimeloyl-ACP methyl ester carboxylesterase
MVLDLHRLLSALNISTPVVLVGRSLGALPVQLYACEYPSEVAGLVLLDPTPDQFFTTFQAPGIDKAAARPPGERPQSAGESPHLEWNRMPESCAQVRRAIEEQGRMPDVPLVVVAAGIRVEMGAVAALAADFLALAHQHIAQRAPRGRLIVAKKSSHSTMTSEEPELIIATIRSILTGAR